MNRLRILPLLLLAACAGPRGGFGPHGERYVPTMEEHVRTLSSEEMSGRRTGSNGALAAASYIADQFRALGFATASGRRPTPTMEYLTAISALLQNLSGGDEKQNENIRELVRSLEEMLRQLYDRLYGAVPHDYFQEFEFGHDQPRGRCRNVVAVLPGTDLRDEAIVIGAHYDHLGTAEDRVHPSQGTYYPGADDNASGVAVLLEVAAKLGSRRLKRTVVFVLFSGEEIGLWGSKTYVGAPAVPLAKTLAMINMDMVGRMRDRKLSVIGVDTAGEFEDVLKGATRLTVVPGKGGVGPSDHTSFYLKGVPVLHLFTGAHADHHATTDTADKLNYGGMAEVADFVVELVQRLAERPSTLTWNKSSVEVRPVEGEPGPRPYLGAMPEYTFEGPGVQVASVMAGSPAEKAGLDTFDVILKVDGKDVKDVNEYTKILYSYKPGDTITLKVKRGTEELELKVTLGSRPKK